MEPKMSVAKKSFIVKDNKILLLRESQRYKDGTNAGRFDVVGGRAKPGQRFDESLLREIKEETGLDVKIGKPFFANEWRPVVRGEEWHIIGIFFLCEALSENFTLSEDHEEFKWIDPKEYKEHNLIPGLHSLFEAFLKSS